MTYRCGVKELTMESVQSWLANKSCTDDSLWAEPGINVLVLRRLHALVPFQAFLVMHCWHSNHTVWAGAISCDGCTRSLPTGGHVLCLPAPTKQVKCNIMWHCDWVQPSGCRCGYFYFNSVIYTVYQTLHRCSVFSLTPLRSLMNSPLKWRMFWTC